MEKKKGTKAKRTEKNVYMAIIIILALYGLRDSEEAVRLIHKRQYQIPYDCRFFPDFDVRPTPQ